MRPYYLDSSALTRYRFVELEPAVIEEAGQLLGRHPMRAFDAVQLGSALVAARTLADAGLAQPRFLSADERLLAFAEAEGLTGDNPSRYA